MILTGGIYMSKVLLINEITTTVKMSTTDADFTKLQLYLDDLLSNYKIEAREEIAAHGDSSLLIDTYIDSLKVENYAASTLTNYRYELYSFCKFIDKHVLQAKTSDIRAYLAAHEDAMQSTIGTKLNRISAFYNWLVAEDELLKNPCSRINTPKTPKKVRDGLTIVELEKVRAACNAPKKKNQNLYTLDCIRKRALVEVLYSTACRLDELHKLNRDDIDWHTGAILVTGKGDKQRRVYLSEKAMFYLERYLASRTDNCEALFTTIRKPIRRLNHSGIQYVIKLIAKDAQLNRSLHPHIFRHTFAQQALNAGMPLEDLQSYLGHERMDTTMRYAAVSEERKFASFKQYHVQ